MDEIYHKIHKITESFFNTASDPDQIPVTEESNRKLLELHPATILYKTDEEGEPIAWRVTIPTSLETMKKFLSYEISERELLDIAVKERKFEALYICSVFTVPTHRREGLSKTLFSEMLKRFQPSPDTPLYTWLYSEDGKKSFHAIERILGKKILVRPDVPNP